MKRVAAGLAVTTALFLLLSVPSPEPSVPPAEHPRTFVWNQDARWHALEAEYARARAAGCPPGVMRATRSRVVLLEAAVAVLSAAPVEPEAATLDSLEAGFFALAPAIAACPGDGSLAAYVRMYERMREAIKAQSRHWDMTSAATRNRLYRALYGGRAAVEEVMLQHPDSAVTLLPGIDEPSATPAATVHGVVIHSGDILVSRGGYPTSALIARGNDYPGNFSHVGLLHVDSATHAVSVIEAHIERGVAITTADGYLADKKLRIMVLRLRADLPQLLADPRLPHRASSQALARARTEHIPYDFTMDYHDPSRLFCSEVASWVYRDQGVNLWMGISTVSAMGLRRWLASFGVRHFETQEPSDLEYDPQLVVVAEWRDPRTLFRDHVDNAVIDAMLEGAERGERLTYAWYALAPARVAKGWSWMKERSGGIGPVPEGMAAAAALRNSRFSQRERAIAARVSERAAAQARELGYPPPYWTLLAMAREEAARHH
jgi:permuted papain-like amidase YaeF/Yiix C92 family enzyme